MELYLGVYNCLWSTQIFINRTNICWLDPISKPLLQFYTTHPCRGDWTSNSTKKKVSRATLGRVMCRPESVVWFSMKARKIIQMALDIKLLTLCEINRKCMYFDFVLQRSLYLFISRKRNYVHIAICVRLKTDRDFHLPHIPPTNTVWYMEK
jgi:hypothetical protein